MPNTGAETRSQSPYWYRLDLPLPFSGDGTEDFNQWIRRLEVAVLASPGFQDSKLADILPSRLTGAAFNFWDSLPHDTKANFQAVKDRLQQTFGKRLFILTFQTNIRARTREPGEPLEVYAAELSKLVDEAFPRYGTVAKEGECFRRFIAGIDPYIQLKVHELGATTFKQAIEYAGRIERAHQASQITVPVTVSSTPSIASQTTSVPFPTILQPTTTSKSDKTDPVV